MKLVSRGQRAVEENRKPDRLRDLGVGEMSRVGPLEHDHARICPQPQVELPVADIDRINPGSIPPQQDVGEPAGGCADVETDPARGIDAEGVETCDQLVRPTADMLVHRAHGEQRVRGQRQSGLVEPLLAAEDAPGEHQRLRPGPAVGQAAVDQKSVEADLGRCLGHERRWPATRRVAAVRTPAPAAYAWARTARAAASFLDLGGCFAPP